MVRSGFLRVLFLAFYALVAGLIGYQVGVGSSAAAAGATVIVTGGGPGFGFLFFLFFVGVLLFAFGGRRHRSWGQGHGAWGPGAGSGRWGGPPTPGGDPADADPRHRWVADMHRRLHAVDAAATDSAPTAGEPPNAAGQPPSASPIA